MVVASAHNDSITVRLVDMGFASVDISRTLELVETVRGGGGSDDRMSAEEKFEATLKALLAMPKYEGNKDNGVLHCRGVSKENISFSPMFMF